MILCSSWPEMRQLVVTKRRLADKTTQMLHSVQVPCDFTSPLSKLSYITGFFTDFSFYLQRNSHSAGFSAAGLNVCNFIFKNEGENPTLECLALFVFRSVESRLPRLSPLGMK